MQGSCSLTVVLTAFLVLSLLGLVFVMLHDWDDSEPGHQNFWQRNSKKKGSPNAEESGD